MTISKKVLKLILILLALVLAGALCFFVLTVVEKKIAQENASEAVSQESEFRLGTLYYNGQKYYPKTNLSTLLIMGIDDLEISQETNPNRNSSQADFLVLAVVDREEKTCKLIQINRDTMTDVPILGVQGTVVGYETEQIALAHTYGDAHEQSCENTVDAVERLLYDISIEHYVSYVMGGISAFNDYVGGVSVTVRDDFTGVDDTLIQGQTITLNGTQAENFVRARMSMVGDATNIGRMERQKEYFSGLFQVLKTKNAENNLFAAQMYSDLSQYITTDCTAGELSSLGSLLSDSELSDIIALSGQSVEGTDTMEFYADEAALKELVLDVFYEPAS